MDESGFKVNCSIHHNRAERGLDHFFFFGLQCVQYAFLPTNSPDLNPVENCFGQIKKILLQERYPEIIS
jgi:transposase